MLGRLMHLLRADRRHVARVNIELCFPELTPRQRRARVRAHFAALGESVLETAVAWWGPRDRLRALGRVVGREHLDAALARGRGVILLQGHFLTTDIAGQILGTAVPFTATYAPPTNPVMRVFTERKRARFIRRQIHHEDVRAVIRALAANEIVWHGPDQGAKKRHAIEARFFGVPAATNSATARLARISGAAVVPYHPIRLDDGHYELRLEPALSDFPGNDVAAATQRVNDTIERHVRAAPTQYLWAHKRFKARSKREPGPYDR